jgi:hypothetical protein
LGHPMYRRVFAAVLASLYLLVPVVPLALVTLPHVPKEADLPRGNHWFTVQPFMKISEGNQTGYLPGASQ